MRQGSQEPSRFRVRSYLKAFALHWGQPVQTFCYLPFCHKKAALNCFSLFLMQDCFESTGADDGPVKSFQIQIEECTFLSMKIFLQLKEKAQAFRMLFSLLMTKCCNFSFSSFIIGTCNQGTFGLHGWV